MPNFPSAGAGFAQGFSSTYIPRKMQAKEMEFAQQQAQEQAEAVATQADIDRMREVIDNVREGAISTVNDAASQVREAISSSELPDEGLEKLQQEHIRLAEASIASARSVYEELAARTRVLGGDDAPIRAEMESLVSQLKFSVPSAIEAGLAMRQSTQPNISAARQRVVPAEYTDTGKAEERDVFTEEANGTVRNFIVDDQGNKTYVSGLSTPIDRVEQGGPGAFDVKALNESEIAARNYIASVGDAITLLSESPDVNTFVARSAAFVNDLKQEMSALGRELGLKFDPSALEPGSYTKAFDDLGIANARMRSLITTLAFQRAAAAKQTGQSLSNRDVERFITELGASASRPDVFSQVLTDSAKRADRQFRTVFKVNTGEDFSGDIGLEALPQYKDTSSTAPQGVTADDERNGIPDISNMTDEELLEFIQGP